MAYYNKMTKAEKMERLGKLQQARRKMEQNEPMKSVLGTWAKFKKLPYSEQARIKNEWDEYYKKCEESTMGLLFADQHKSLLEKNSARFKDLAEQAGSMRRNGAHITLVAPRSIDPLEFEHGSIVNAYKSLDRAIKELTDYPIDEAAAVEEAENAQAFL